MPRKERPGRTFAFVVDKFNSIFPIERKFVERDGRHYHAAPQTARPSEFQSGPPMTKLFQTILRDESGATAIEYGLIAALIAVVIIAAVTTVGTNLSTTFANVSASIK